MNVYSVGVRRVSVDYILLSAESEEQAQELAQKLLDEGTGTIQLGDDGYESEEIVSSRLEENVNDSDRVDVGNNDEALKEINEQEA